MDQHRGRLGFQPIGSLISRTVSTQRASDGTASASDRKSTPSPTGAVATSRSMPTGTRPGGSGAVTQTNSLPATIVSMAPLGTLQRDPAALLRPHVMSRLASTWEVNNTGWGWDGYVSGYELDAPISE